MIHATCDNSTKSNRLMRQLLREPVGNMWKVKNFFADKRQIGILKPVIEKFLKNKDIKEYTITESDGEWGVFSQDDSGKYHKEYRHFVKITFGNHFIEMT